MMLRKTVERRRSRPRPPARGINYVEVMLATLLLAVCLLPALNSVSNAISSNGVSPGMTRTTILCVKSRLEIVSADPYSALLNAATAAGSIATASAYSVGAIAPCPALQVYLARFDADNPSSPYPGSDTGLILIKITAPDNAFVLSTLVTRQ